MGSLTKQLAVMTPPASSLLSITILYLLGPHSAASPCSPEACSGQGTGWTCSNSDTGNCMASMDFCKTDKEDGCRPGWMEFGGRCYYVSTEAKSVTKDTSDAECRKLDTRAHLPSIGSQQEQDYIAQYAKDAHIWLGATDRDTEGVWTWTDGQPWGYTKWAPNEPNNLGNGKEENCVYMRSLRQKNEWNDFGCGRLSSMKFRLMCSYDPKSCFCCPPECKDTDGSCGAAHNGSGVCINVNNDDLSNIDFTAPKISGLCNSKLDCCGCYKKSN